MDRKARILSLLLTAGLAVSFFTGPSFADGYYGAYPVYRPLDVLSPNGAALGPWRWNFDFGGGPAPILGSARHSFDDGWNFTVGGGYNFTPRLGLVFEFMDTSLGVTDQALQDHQATGGDAFIWSATLNPIWRFRIAGPVGGYLIGGGGYYEVDTRYTEQVQVFVPTFHGGFFAPGLENVRDYDGTGGLNAGAGLTCNLGWGTKLFVEVRYHYLFTGGSGTQILPITVGLRW